MLNKGVSSVVSTVLMIAVAISIGILVTTWITHWVQQQTGSKDISCAINTNYVVDSAEWNKSGQYNGTLLIKLTNKGKQKLYGFGVVIDNGTKILEFGQSSVGQGGISSSSTLERERSVYLTVNLTNSTLRYPAFGRSLMTSSDVTVKVTNAACDAVPAETNSVS